MWLFVVAARVHGPVEKVQGLGNGSATPQFVPPPTLQTTSTGRLLIWFCFYKIESFNDWSQMSIPCSEKKHAHFSCLKAYTSLINKLLALRKSESFIEHANYNETRSILKWSIFINFRTFLRSFRSGQQGQKGGWEQQCWESWSVFYHNSAKMKPVIWAFFQTDFDEQHLFGNLTSLKGQFCNPVLMIIVVLNLKLHLWHLWQNYIILLQQRLSQSLMIKPPWLTRNNSRH